MEILHVYKDYYPVQGGIENHVRWLAEAQAAAGHAVTVLVCNRGPRTQVGHRQGVRVLRAARLATVASMPLSVRLPWLLARLRPDVVHVHLPFPLGALANGLWGQARATVVTFHSEIVRQRLLGRLYAPWQRRLLQAADAVIVTSPAYLRSARVLQPVRGRCVVVPLGVAPARFAGAAAGHPPGTPVVLFVGRLCYYKGLDTLLLALTRLPEARLVVVGDGPLRRPWQRLAASLGLHDRVVFAGAVPEVDLPAYYAAADVFVLPAGARAEAFGTVLLEAMAAGLPVVSTELGTGTSWVNQAGVTGYVVPPRDVAALAATLQHLLADPALRARMGAAGRRRVREEFGLENMVQGVEAVYRSVLGRERVAGAVASEPVVL